MVPKGWRRVRLGELFDSSKKKGKAGLPTMSVTLNDGLVRRESLERKTDTNLEPEEHLLVKEGYIAYNMMRMWQGASGLASGDGLVSPAYVVLKPKPDIDPLFASYFFKSARSIYLFWAYSYGLTKDRLRLYYPDFSIIRAAIPPQEEQRKIAKILSTWDRAISTIEKLIENSEQQRDALIHGLIGGNLRLPTFQGSAWKIYAFSSIASISKDRFDPNGATESRRCIELEHIKPASGALIGECDTTTQDSMKAVFHPGDVLFGKLRPYLRKFYRPTFEGVCSTEFWVLQPKSSLRPTYLYYLVQTSTFIRAANVSSGSKMPRADWSVVRDTTFEVPSLNEQDSIVNVLQAADALVGTYVSQREKLKEQKTALMQQLLTGQRRVKIGKEQAA